LLLFDFLQASLKLENVVVYFDIIFAGNSSSVLTASTMLEVAASSWSSQVISSSAHSTRTIYSEKSP